MKEKISSILREGEAPFFKWRRIWVYIIGFVAVVGIFFGIGLAYAESYSNRVLPGVSIGSLPVGGMDKDELERFILDMSDKLINDGLHFTLETESKKEELIIYPVIPVDTSAIELIRIDVDSAVQNILDYDKSANPFQQMFLAIKNRINRPSLSIEDSVMVDEVRLKEQVLQNTKEYYKPHVDAGIQVTSINPLNYRVTTSSPGIIFDYSKVVPSLVSAWSRLMVPDVLLEPAPEQPDITEDDVRSIEPRLPAVLDKNGLTITYTDPQTKRDYKWDLGSSLLRTWITVERNENNELGFGINKEKFMAYFEKNIAESINIEPRDARFSTDENDKVVEFQVSRPGIEVDTEASYEAVNKAFFQRTKYDEGLTLSVPVVTSQIEPNISTKDVNDLGITELLGSGVSSFAGSPTNRIKNIALAVKKLNGLLVPPGEEFSTNKFAGPYTLENGYLPEKIIAGDRIEDGVGGGMCQVGTTLFRMAMNSGMPITERANHGLVVSYYNDLVNGNPGTDATVYEPFIDFKFKNDTKNYILVQTEMDRDKQELVFSIWGTNDGRSGTYTRPQVERWIPYGEEKTIETTELPVGEKKCQSPFTGADAFFTYIRTLPDGTIEEREFKSHYRPLPRICLVGVEEKPNLEGLSEEDRIACLLGSSSCPDKNS